MMRVQCPRCPKTFDVTPQMESVRINSDTLSFGFADFVVLHQCDQALDTQPVAISRLKWWCEACAQGKTGGDHICPTCGGGMTTVGKAT